jgi:hypothetical protein
VLVTATVLSATIALFNRVGSVDPSHLFDRSVFVEFVAPAAALSLVSIYLIANFTSVARIFEALASRYPLQRRYADTSVSESVSATERLVAASGDVLVRDFQSRIRKEIDDAVRTLSTQSQQLIKSQLSERINEAVGDNIVSVLGKKLAEQTHSQNQLNILKQDSFDRFVQMRNRALQYAQAAKTQATYFRWIGIALALGGLSTLGAVLYLHQGQFLGDPTMIERHVEWPMFLLRHGPSYAFVALCEFLALIMFRYQSKSLEYMRYFSNEATNIDARHVAFMSGLRFMDKIKLAKLIENLEATERNFLIGKDQRTIELANNENEDRLFDRLKRFSSAVRAEGDEDEGPKPRKKKTAKKKP